MGLKNLALWVTKPYRNDQLFNLQSPLNRDNALVPMRMLKEKIERYGGRCHTADVYRADGKIPDVVLFFDIPILPIKILLGSWGPMVRKWVILFESEVVKSQNWNTGYHRQFEVIFTWNDQYLDGKKYIKINYPQVFPDKISEDSFHNRKLCTLIAGNKRSDHPLELYSKRVEAIRWFEKNHPEYFDLYGVNWNLYTFSDNILGKVFNKAICLRRYYDPRFPSYKGTIKNKKPVLQGYRFAICYENARDIKGYITEKIFDCLFSGCIPIYWGANNVTDHIPPACFVDAREYNNYDTLYEFISNVDEKTYKGYISNMQQYLLSDQSYQFTADNFINTIINKMGLV